MSDDLFEIDGPPARRPAPDDVLLQWATGLTTSDRRIYAGWFIECGKDEALDQAAHAAGLPRVTIKHGDGNLVTHWALETANLFIIAEGLQSTAEMKATDERYGVAYWGDTTDTGRFRSNLRARVLVRELWVAGYAQPLTVTAKSTLTGDVLNAFGAVYDALDAARALKGRDLPLYSFAVPIGPGAEVERGSKGASKVITPPVAKLPQPITRDWLLAQFIGKDGAARCAELLPATVAWSMNAARAEQHADEAPSNGESPIASIEGWSVVKRASAISRIRQLMGEKGATPAELATDLEAMTDAELETTGYYWRDRMRANIRPQTKRYESVL